MSIIHFEPTKLEGKWFQLATNDPTIPKFCNKHTINWELKPNQKDYDFQLVTKCYNKVDVKVNIHGKIVNNELYENFKPLIKVNKNNIVNIVEENNNYNIIEFIAKYDIFNIYHKNIYQLWSRKHLTNIQIKKYIDCAKIKYNINDIRIIY
jgi:lipocalin